MRCMLRPAPAARAGAEPPRPRARSRLYGYAGEGAVRDAISGLYRRAGLLPGEAGAPERRLRVYTDMVADLYHLGHVRYLKQCAGLGPPGTLDLVVGIHSDETVESYKRTPVCTMEERIECVDACKHVNEVVPRAPLDVSEEYMAMHKCATPPPPPRATAAAAWARGCLPKPLPPKPLACASLPARLLRELALSRVWVASARIDIVVAGSGSTSRKMMYGAAIRLGQYTEVPRTPNISTTDLIARILSRGGDTNIQQAAADAAVAAHDAGYEIPGGGAA